MSYGISVLVLLVLVTVAKAQSNFNNATVHIDDFIAANKIQYEAVLKDYDWQLKAFTDLYYGRIDTTETQLTFLLSSLKHTEDRLYTLQVLSDYSKGCVNKYKSSLPTENTTLVVGHNCTQSALKQLDYLTSTPVRTRANLQKYYENNFEKGIQGCKNNTNASSSMNYTLCITNVVSAANVFTIDNQKTFENQMDSANCAADGYVKTALDCSFNLQSSTVALISSTNTRIDNCIQGSDCTTCTGFYCENVEHMPTYMVNSNNKTMTNPFYGRNETLHCLMLDIY